MGVIWSQFGEFYEWLFFPLKQRKLTEINKQRKTEILSAA